MMDELIAKIAAQTGQSVETVTPIVGALLAHLGDVLPAPLAHQLAIMLGVHSDDKTASDDTAAPATGGFLGSVMGQLEGSAGSGGEFAGATSLANVGQSLLGSFLSGRR
jgi:hypothetical protein